MADDIVDVTAEVPPDSSAHFFTPQFRERLSLGDDVRDEDVLSEFEQLAQRREELEKSQAEIEELRKYRAQYEQVAPHLSEFQEYLRSKQAPQESAPEEELDLPRPPEVPQHLMASIKTLTEHGMLSRDQTGLWKASDPAYSAVAGEANSYAAKERAFYEQWNRNPQSMVEKIFDHKSKAHLKQIEELKKALEEKTQRYDAFIAQQSISDRLLQESDKYWVSEDGKLVPTPYGAAYDYQARFLREMVGLTDPGKIHELAESHAQAVAAQQAKPPEDKKTSFLQKQRESRRSAQNGHNRIKDVSVPKSEHVAEFMHAKDHFKALAEEAIAKMT